MSGFSRRCCAVLALLFVALVQVPVHAKDGITEIHGVVQTMPSGSFVGNWTIAGRTIRVDAATIIKQEIAAVGVGAVVEVKAVDDPSGGLLAQRIEVQQGVGSPAPGPSGEFTGTVEALPASGLVGTWRIAGRNVVVSASTPIDQEHGGVAVGTLVEVHGTVNADGTVTASRIEVRSGGTTTPVAGTGRVEIHGLVEALPPSGLVGTWTVAGRTVQVTSSAILDAEHGAFALGVAVEVEATKASDGTLTASRIESKAGVGAGVPAEKFWGRIVALPSGGLIGVWKIDDKSVDVTATTELETSDGPFAVGAIVKVAGWVQADTTILAKEIETQSRVGESAAQGTVAVEFRHQSLGHFFVTANTAEIAVLDAGAFGGGWKRTGESFKVGGAQGVCRFYGMPPRGPDSHFFTADPNECRKVMDDYRAWTFEDHAFAVTPPTDGACAAGLLAVHRFYNAPSRAEDMNHRYTVSAAAFAETTALGWTHEGVVMCIPQ